MKLRHGFTLIEMLVVVAIIGVLVSILTPVINSARASARSKNCQSNLRQVALAFRLYADSNQSRFPRESQGEFWFVKIAPYMELQEAVYQCPDDTEGSDMSYDWRDDATALPAAGVAGRRMDLMLDTKIVLVFDQTAGWHAPDALNVALVGGATMTMEESAFELNLLNDPVTGKLLLGNTFAFPDDEDFDFGF